MDTIYHGLKEDGIRSLIKEIDRISSRAETYKVLSETPEGQFLIADMRSRLDFTRSQYKYIESTSPEAPYLLATMQSTERELEVWISTLTKKRELIADLGNKRESLIQLLKSKKDKGRSDTQMVPTDVKKKMSDDDKAGDKI